MNVPDKTEGQTDGQTCKLCIERCEIKTSHVHTRLIDMHAFQCIKHLNEQVSDNAD